MSRRASGVAPATDDQPAQQRQHSAQLAQRTLELLWQRTRQQGDMPAFAKAIGAILSAMRGEDEHAFDMTQTVLSDPVLTQKVLRLANSGMYAAFGRHVSTVSKAVLVLGSDAIGHLALGLKLVEELSQASPGSVGAHMEMEKAVLAGMVARQVADTAATPHGEEAVVCAMLHTLGRMMLTFYLGELWAELQQRGGPGNEADAAPALLGMTIDELGLATAARWGLPANLISGMRRIAPPEPGGEPAQHYPRTTGRADWMAGLATMATACADVLWHDEPAGDEQVHQVATRYAPLLGLAPEAVLGAVARAKVLAAAELNLAPLSRPAEREARLFASIRLRAEGNRTLAAGLAEMRDALPGASPGHMVALALETVYQGLDFTRALAFVRQRRDGHAGRYMARLGLGDGAAALLPQLQFSDTYEANVFHAALSSDRVIFIDNAREPKFAAKLPPWWKQTLAAARCFVILPLSAHGQPAGFLYDEWDASVPPVALNQAQFGLLNEMRALVVEAIESRHQQELTASKVA